MRRGRLLMRLYPWLISLLPLLFSTGATQQPAWRDLNHNGRLDPYEDSRLSAERRVDDLIARMTLAEKVGAMMHGTLPAVGPMGMSGMGADYDQAAARKLIEAGVNSFITRLVADPAKFAVANNAIQTIAAGTRLGIPVTISTDPRNHFQAVTGASTTGGGFSQWPEPLGLGALGDVKRVEEFGRLVAREYRAVGIHLALSPQADLFTEPRWPRGSGTFGDDPTAVSRLAGAYVRGFQGGRTGLVPGGVATVVKHWVGYGAAPGGFDAHNQYGRYSVLDQQAFAEHVAAFRGALAAGSAGVMPSYGIIQGVRYRGVPLPAVGGAYSPVLLQAMLRGEQRFRGLVLSDWGIASDCPQACVAPTASQAQHPGAIGMPWGVEALSKEDRFARATNAGIDQFGGADDPAPLLAAVQNGKVSVGRINEAVRQVLLLKFRLGLFDRPFVDAKMAESIVGAPEAHRAGQLAQRESMVLLQNKRGVLPIAAAGRRVWLSGVSGEAASAVGLQVVDRPEQAEVAIIRTSAPHQQLHPYHFFGVRQNEGSLEFASSDPAIVALDKAVVAKVPVAFAIDLDRPAILKSIAGKTSAMIATFGASDAALLDVVTGRARARGRLPIELPSSMTDVERQNPARPNDSVKPLFPRGFALLLNRR